jgi:hypothetical protein
MWNMGKITGMMSWWESVVSSMKGSSGEEFCVTFATMLWWVSWTPFGSPVVPLE